MPKNNWKRLGKTRRAGVLAPLFSIYSEDSAGIGDLDDLKLMIDWCKDSGLSTYQLLPMNEVGPTFCPYDAVSSFALEPMYISLKSLPEPDDKAAKSRFSALRKKFPAGGKNVNYGIKEAKRELLWQVFSGHKKGRKSAEFEKFLSENGYWINDFAVFKVLKACHMGKPWYEWADGYRDRDPEMLAVFTEEHAPYIEFEKWMQWLAFKQFKAAKDHAASKGVFICGDLPILTSKDSADVWAHREFFKLDFLAGAPPDMYCAKGQRWSMPTYDWGAIADDGYRYLREKLRYAENFYDMIRIDHVVGLFRIWSIPANSPAENEGLNGFFDPADENVWAQHAKTILSVMLEGTSILFCAEDLGMIPKDCPATLKEFEIPGNEVQRWVKDWAVTHDFLAPKDYRLFSVAMLSTHDTTNWAAWWENEAGTIDGALFDRRTANRGIDCENAKRRLFDPALSKHGRLRWLKSVVSADVLAEALGKRREEIADFIEMYQNTYLEKEKLWERFGLKGPMREKCDSSIIAAALSFTLGSRSIFCIELLNDYLYMDSAFDGDPYEIRINKPGTVNKTNWSMVIPVSLDEMLKSGLKTNIKKMVVSADRV
ncbi:MAG: 4-alpha-glucanotransferase [Candidatus Omnitrophica bacterium]|nr:4-alpha-glucanotransferase [Candidatus Omnitrophota bacterium]